MKKVVRAIVPPVFFMASRFIYSMLFKSKSEELFDGDDLLFKRVLKEGLIYAEYGCGASTVWVAKNVGCKIYSVDSSREWIDKVEEACSEGVAKALGLYLHLADVGPIGKWGCPVGYEKFENFSDYTDWIWMREEKPDIVLIDGRFRVCCFLTCLLNGKRGDVILFDDYTNRPEYHFVERYLRPVEVCGRQALFVIPDAKMLDFDQIKEAVEKFRFVFD